MAKDNRNNQSGGSYGSGQNQGGGNNQQSSGSDGGSNQGSNNQADNQSGDIENTNDIENVDGSGWSPGKVGEVQDEDYDGRLKENRAAGESLGTTEHSAAAPHAKDKDQSSDRSDFNNQDGGNNQGNSNR